MGGTLVIDRPEVLADEPVTFSVTGCEPGEIVTVTASWVAGDEEATSEARFEAPATGVVEPARLPSRGGSYTGVDPYGLWSLAELKEFRSATKDLEPWTVTVTSTGTAWESSGSLVRAKLARSVRRIDVASGPLRGIAFVPEGTGPFPGVLLVTGSGGGVASVQCSAALLASRGFATFALAYFNYPDLPSELVDIPLEYFRAGMDWLSANVPVSGRIAVMGESRGGELALLLGSTFPERIAAVVAMVPSGVVWAGLTRGPSEEPRPAWTWRGRPVPAMPESSAAEAGPPPRRGDAVVYTPSFLASLADASPQAREAAEIPVEKAGGPILLTSGEDDALWPSTTLAEIAVQRARSRGAQFPVRHLSFPDAGHVFTRPAGFPIGVSAVHPVMGENIAYGGSAAGNARASVSAWHEITGFLRASLPAPGSAR